MWMLLLNSIFMKQLNKLKKVLSCCLLSMFLYSCNAGIDLGAIDDTSIKIDGTLVVPVGEANLTVKDLFDKIGIPSGLDTLHNEIFFSWNYSDNVTFPEFTFADKIDEKIYRYHKDKLTIADNKVEGHEYLDLGFNDVGDDDRVDSLFVNSTKILTSVEIPPRLTSIIKPSEVNVEFVFDPKYLKIEDGSKLNFTPREFGANRFDSITMGKYFVNFVQNGSVVKDIPYDVIIRVSNVTSAGYLLAATDSFRVHVKFENIDYKVAYGKFNLTDKGIAKDDIPFKVSDYLPDALLRFKEPTVSVKATSNIGADFSFNLNSLSAIYTEANKKLDFDFKGSSSISHPVPGPAVFGQTVVTDMPLFDKTNGALDKVFDSYPYPDKYEYSYNYANMASRTKEFISPSGKVRFDVKVNIPIELKGGSWYNVTDTLTEVNFSDLLNNVDSASLILKINNALPFRGKIRMTLLDVNKDSIPNVEGSDLLISTDDASGFITSPYVVRMPAVNSTGDVVLPVTPQTIQIRLTKSQTEKLKQTKYIVYKLNLDNESVDGTLQPTHLTTVNTFDVKIGVLFNKAIESKNKSDN